MVNPESIRRISFVGSGNIATNLAVALREAGIEILEVYSPNIENAHLLADRVDCNAVDELGALSAEADLYILAVPDVQIKLVSEKLPLVKGIVAHTSGITPLANLSDKNKRGVFYPLQTFTKDRLKELADVPICIEAFDDEIVNQLKELAEKISNRVVEINSEQRKYLHLAAVMVNNFTNHLYHVAEEILDQQSIDFKLLLPLIKESAVKIQDIDPVRAQTGPARRNDQETIEQHIEMLKGSPEYQNLYQLISKQITDKYHE